MTRSSWWRGSRGEWYVVVQMCLFALVAAGPRTWRGWPRWPFPSSVLVAVIGWILLTSGGVLVACGIVKLGSRICAVPYPPSGAVLQRTGAFCLVRHPMYCGGILAAFGWALVSRGWLTLIYALLLFVLFDLKSRREEAWLVERFVDYPDYQKQVRKLIPFVY
jgi:protein-S-isoprenylcysteine O-methyltransferase Ste14